MSETPERRLWGDLPFAWLFRALMLLCAWTINDKLADLKSLDQTVQTLNEKFAGLEAQERMDHQLVMDLYRRVFNQGSQSP